MPGGPTDLALSRREAPTAATHPDRRETTVCLRLYRARGCDHCHGTGYRGRIGVFELLVMTDHLRALALRGASAQQLRDAAQEKGMRLMWQDGVQKVLKGTTTMEELLRVVFASEETSLPEAR